MNTNTISAAVALAGTTFIVMGSWSEIAIFWKQPRIFLTGVAAAGAVALINSVGNLSGFVGPYVIGLVRDRTGSFTGSLYGLAGSSLVATLFIAVLAFRDRRTAKRRTVTTA